MDAIWDLIYLFSSPFAVISLYILILDWKSVCYSERSKKAMINYLPPLVG